VSSTLVPHHPPRIADGEPMGHANMGCSADPARTEGPVPSGRKPPALRSSATRDRSAGPATCRSSLRCLLSLAGGGPPLTEVVRRRPSSCGPNWPSPSGPRATCGLLTLPRPSSAVRCRPSLQVGGSCSSADVVAERHESEWLAVNLAVKSRSTRCRDAAAVAWPASAAGCCNSWNSATALSA
jgi:hypothetical protein